MPKPKSRSDREDKERQSAGVPAKAAAPRGLQVMSWEAVPLAEIDPSDMAFQYRLSTEVPELRLSLEKEGQREPIDLTEGPPYRVIDGFRRIRAATELGWPTVKAFVHRGLLDDEAYRIAFTKNVIRRNLSPLERAQAMVVATRKRKLKEGELAAAFGISEKQVKRYLDLLDFPPAILSILDGDTISMAHARVLAQFGITDDADKWKKRIASERLDARSLARLLAKEQGKKPAGRPKSYLRRVGNRLRVYGFSISTESPKDEREKVVTLLKEAIKFLER